MFDVLHGLRGKILALCLGSLTLLGLTAFPYLLDPADRTQAQAEIQAKTVTAADHKATTRCRIRTKDGRLQLVRAITRLKSSPYHGAVYYAVIVEED